LPVSKVYYFEVSGHNPNRREIGGFYTSIDGNQFDPHQSVTHWQPLPTEPKK